MKKVRIIIALLFVAAMLFGCAPAANSDAAMESASGGSALTADKINLKDISISTSANETVVTLSFLSGSRTAGYTESKLLSLPEYSVEQLASPQRIMITLQDISFWDYEQKGFWAFSDFLPGFFQEAPAANDSLVIYLQLSQQAKFTVAESEGNLIIRLQPSQTIAGKHYYCVSNSFYEHQEGTWPQSIAMEPVLCSDLKNKLLISQPFDSLEDAENYRNSISAALQNVLPGNSLNVIELTDGALPDYTDIDFSAAENTKVMMKDGTAISTTLLLQNGRYLATAPSGRIAFARIYRPEEPALQQDEYLTSEKLWILDLSGRVQSVEIPEFYSIASAGFSFDSRYICLLDVSIENSVVYVYDFVTKTFWNLGEEGFGNHATAFVWSDTDDTLYAMTGSDGTLQMRSCKFSEDGTISIQAVEEEPGAEGHLGFSQGRLYFADNYAGVIYQIGETRTEIASGMDFRISSDGATMAVLETSLIDGEQVLTNLKLYDLATGQNSTVAENADIASFAFSPSGNTLYYTDSAVDDNASDEYPYGLFACDTISGEKKLVAMCSTGDVEVGPTGAIYLIQYFGGAENSFYATYQYDLK